MNSKMVIMSLGIGDMVFAEPGFRAVLDSGVDVIHLFARRDGLKLYDSYPGVEAHPLEAKQTFFELARAGVRYISLNAESHPFYDYRNRVAVFADAIVTGFGLPALMTVEPPQLPVTPELAHWAEIYVNRPDGRKAILWQMDASKPYKTLPRDKSLRMIERLANEGCRVLAIANNHAGLPRLRNVKWMRGITIDRFMAVCQQVDRVIAHDSAPAWIASAVGANTVAIFGPTNPTQFAIRGENVTVLRWTPEARCVTCAAGCDNIRCLTELPDDVLFEAAYEGKIPERDQEDVSEWQTYTTAAILLPATKPAEKLITILDALLDQTYRRFELVIGDATDSGLWERGLARYVGMDERIKLIRLPAGTPLPTIERTLAEYAQVSGFIFSFPTSVDETWSKDRLGTLVYDALRGD